MTAFLLGKWQFDRHVVDRKSGISHTAQGQLQVTQSTWQESGIMDTTTHFTLSYGLQFQENGITVTFPDGQLFYTLDTITENAPIEHLCGDDVYRGQWIYTNANSFTLIWHVIGPKKNYTMTTHYQK